MCTASCWRKTIWKSPEFSTRRTSPRPMECRSYGRCAPLALRDGSASKSAVEEEDVRARIRSSGADIVFVAIGAPKREQWMHEHRDCFPGVTLIGVGAGFDFFAGRTRQAPRWMQNEGLEWLFRLVTEPFASLAALPAHLAAISAALGHAITSEPAPKTLTSRLSTRSGRLRKPPPQAPAARLCRSTPAPS
jgi:hypothetical protein